MPYFCVHVAYRLTYLYQGGMVVNKSRLGLQFIIKGQHYIKRNNENKHGYIVTQLYHRIYWFKPWHVLSMRFIKILALLKSNGTFSIRALIFEKNYRFSSSYIDNFFHHTIQGAAVLLNPFDIDLGRKERKKKDRKLHVALVMGRTAK